VRTFGHFAAAVLGLLIFTGGTFAYKHFGTSPVPPMVRSPKPPTLPKDCSAFQQALASASSPAPSPQSIENKSPLNADETEIYTTVVQEWVADPAASLNVANRTLPLDATADSAALINCACESEIAPETLLKASLSFHRLTPGVLPKQVRLVDPEKQGARVHASDPHTGVGQGKSVEEAVTNAFANGLFSVSEIAFDKEHRHALLRFSFVCGSLCGSGNTVLFERVRGRWKRTDRACGGWVS
jgi:hypothetical protein